MKYLYISPVDVGPGRGIVLVMLLLSSFAGFVGVNRICNSFRAFGFMLRSVGAACVFGLIGEEGALLDFVLSFRFPFAVVSLRILIWCAALTVEGAFLV